MKNIFRNSAKITIALLLLGFFVFSFLHSELGFLDYDGDNHGAHDYCEIVKNTNTHSKILRAELPKLELNKDICFQCFEEIEAQTAQTSFEIIDHHLKAKPFAKLHISNRTFLI
jgi:hypothetical protein